MKVLVTGSRGFIGAKLVERLRENGDDVCGFDIAEGQDICDSRKLQKAIDGKDAVFHLAAVADLNWARIHPNQTRQINIEGTWNIAFACKKAHARLYFASTCCVYGNQKVHPVSEDTLPNPAELYACSKLAGESIIKGLHYTYGLEYNLMRFATIYGEGTRSALGTHIFFRQALTGQPITIHGDGKQTRTLTHINDLIEAIISLYKSGKKNDVWNMTATKEISALEMAQDIKALAKSSSKIIFIPQRIGQTFKEQISADKMKNEVGWQAKTTWQDGIGMMYEWFVKTGQVGNVYIEPK